MRRIRNYYFVFVLGITFLVLAYLKITTLWPIGELAELQANINKQAELTTNGQIGQVEFKTEFDTTLIISPPYANLKNIGDGIDENLLKEMQSKVDWTETGHLFMIQQAKIIGHRLLSGSAEPILTKAQGKEFIFIISKIETSGRPIRIEMESR
jgi:hypothetical protein